MAFNLHLSSSESLPIARKARIKALGVDPWRLFQAAKPCQVDPIASGGMTASVGVLFFAKIMLGPLIKPVRQPELTLSASDPYRRNRPLHAAQ